MIELKVTLPYDPDWRALIWAKKHCPSYITNSGGPGNTIVYYFSNRNEALTFGLKWAC